MSGKAKLNIDGTEYELPIIKGSEGETGIDITTLRASTKAITLDNGFMNTGSCQSAITFLNGEKGILRYRGYPIEQLADNSNFLEVSYLLNYGELPSGDQLNKFTSSVKENAALPDGVKNIIDQFPKDAHPMGVMAGAMAALSQRNWTRNSVIHRYVDGEPVRCGNHQSKRRAKARLSV